MNDCNCKTPCKKCKCKEEEKVECEFCGATRLATEDPCENCGYTLGEPPIF